MSLISRDTQNSTGILNGVFLLLMFFSAQPIHAGPVGVAPEPGKSYVIKVDGKTSTLTGNQLKMLKTPAGAAFKLTKGPVISGVQIILISAIAPGPEPNVDTIGFAPTAPSSMATVGVLPTVPGEMGFESLVFTGLNTDTAVPGSTFSIGIVGGPTASYVTKTGDTFSTIYSNLLLTLHSDAVQAFEAGPDLTVLSTITNESTFAGAVNFTSTDPTLKFDVDAGTVTPEPASLTLGALGIVGLLGYALWKRSSALKPTAF